MKKSQNMLFIIKQDITIKAVKYDCETNVKFSQLARNLMELQSKTFLQERMKIISINIFYRNHIYCETHHERKKEINEQSVKFL
jgi:hypothetical protein